jgi:hypothetical protein
MSFPDPSPEAGGYVKRIIEPHPHDLQIYALNRFLGAYFKYPNLDTTTDSAELAIIAPYDGNMHIKDSLVRQEEEGTYGNKLLSEDERKGKDRQGRPCGYTPGASADDNLITIPHAAREALGDSAKNVLFVDSTKTAHSKRHRWQRRKDKGPLKITHLWCENSCWVLLYAAWALRQRQKQGECKHIRMKKLEGSNHFVRHLCHSYCSR